MNKLNFQTKNTGDSLEAQEWNQAVSKIDELVEANNTGGGGRGVIMFQIMLETMETLL